MADWRRRGAPDEELISSILDRDGCRTIPAGSRHQSYDLEVTLGIEHVEPGLYEVKRLHKTKSGSFDRRFKVGRRGEDIYGRRDAEIKSFALALENFLDDALWGYDAVTQTHEFIDQALQRRHGKKFHERLLRLANASLKIPSLTRHARAVLDGNVRGPNIHAGFVGLKGIFVIAGDIYTLVKPSEYTRFIGFNSAGAEGPKLSYQGVVPYDKNARKAKG